MPGSDGRVERLINVRKRCPASGAIGTSYVQGVPILLRPLPVGVHSYVQTASVLVPGDATTPDTGIIFRNSRTITVIP